MSRTEDYLDELLNSVSSEKDTDEENTSGQSAGERDADAQDDFLSTFEKELFLGEDEEAFLQQFEKELAEGEKMPSEEKAERNVDPDELDGILNSARERMQEGAVEEDSAKSQEEEPGQLDGMDIMVDTLGDFPDAMDEEPEETLPDGLVSEEARAVEEDSELMGLLNSEGNLSDIGDLPEPEEEEGTQDNEFSALFAEDSAEPLADNSEISAEGGEPEAEDGKKKKRKKKEKASKPEEAGDKKEGFLKKLGRILFGEEEEPQKEEAVEAALPADIGELTDESLALLKEFEDKPKEKAPEPEEKEEKGKKKKKEKKEKKEKEKKQKKEKKEKPPKPPKEPDRTPPLPKVPVILVFVMAGSLLALILVGTNLFGYSNSFEEAEHSYGLGAYQEAFREISGLDVKEEDRDTYEKYRIMANVSGEYAAYQSFMEANVYDMALDSLVRTIGRCEKYAPDAENYKCSDELEKVRQQAVGALSSFGISETEAVSLYQNPDRKDYSAALYQILERAGLLSAAEQENGT